VAIPSYFAFISLGDSCPSEKKVNHQTSDAIHQEKVLIITATGYAAHVD
jgi:hypothetical protein